MDYRIVDVMGHVEVYDSHGEFLFSADTEAEALEDGQIIELYWKRVSGAPGNEAGTPRGPLSLCREAEIFGERGPGPCRKGRDVVFL